MQIMLTDKVFIENEKEIEKCGNKMWIEVQFLESFHAGTDCSKHSGQDLTKG